MELVKPMKTVKVFLWFQFKKCLLSALITIARHKHKPDYIGCVSVYDTGKYNNAIALLWKIVLFQLIKRKWLSFESYDSMQRQLLCQINFTLSFSSIRLAELKNLTSTVCHVLCHRESLTQLNVCVCVRVRAGICACASVVYT